MAAVEIILSTSFCDVPHFMRVEPAMTSGPTTGAMQRSAHAPRRVPMLFTIAAVAAPSAFARATAPIT